MDQEKGPGLIKVVVDVSIPLGRIEGNKKSPLSGTHYNLEDTAMQVALQDNGLKVGDKMYRCDSFWLYDYEKADFFVPRSIEIGYTKLYVKKITPCGCWVCGHGTNKRHFILDNAKKKFAYRTKELALKAFIARKRRQIEILTDNLKFAKGSLSSAMNIEKNKSWQ